MDSLNQLMNSLSPYFKCRKARLYCLSAMLLALISVRTVNLRELAVALAGKALLDSKHRRFFCHEYAGGSSASLVDIEFSIKFEKYRAHNLTVCRDCKRGNYDEEIQILKYFLLELNGYQQYVEQYVDGQGPREKDSINKENDFWIEKFCEVSKNWIPCEEYNCLICGEDMFWPTEYMRYCRKVNREIPEDEFYDLVASGKISSYTGGFFIFSNDESCFIQSCGADVCRKCRANPENDFVCGRTALYWRVKAAASLKDTTLLHSWA